jgi:hypothetical protein
MNMEMRKRHKEETRIPGEGGGVPTNNILTKTSLGTVYVKNQTIRIGLQTTIWEALIYKA